MNKAKFDNTVTRLATVPQAKERYKIGRTKLMQIAEDNGAVRRFGRSVRIDVLVMDKAIENY